MMKKIALILGISLFATSAYAALGGNAPAVKGFNASKNVGLTYAKNTAGDAWGGASAHDKGDKQFWTSSASRIVAMSFCEPRSWTRVLSS